MILAAFILLAGFFAAYILLPFFDEGFRKKRLDYAENEKESLTHRKNQILEAIRDLEYDHKMNKITDQDYIQLKERLTKEAVEVLKQLDSADTPDAIGQQTRTRI